MSGDVPIPKTTSAYVIFPYDRENRRFITSDYSPAQTKGRASAEEIERFLNEINPLGTGKIEISLLFFCKIYS